ncbi:Flp family type IVb pilin [Vampirovibrio chlorellavorus]|uniref:Flp family type IVb pilin n=1 Tax=Vampirovibrio chlorellavorus TaxID=758823 RepID=UPI0026EF0810|nr:Flp family type IVb pilin [Vampirovibrio chlorellavorus]
MSRSVAKSGVSLTEYGLILACVVCVCLAALQSLGSQLSGQFQSITNKIGKVSGNLGNRSSSPSSPGIPKPPASPPVTAPGSNLGINATGLNPYPNNGIAGSVAGVGDKSPVAATNRSSKTQKRTKP